MKTSRLCLCHLYLILIALLTAILLPGCLFAQTIIELQKSSTAWASSSEDSFKQPGNAFDNLDSTRWASQPNSDPQWLADDLGSTCVVQRVTINWEKGYGRVYDLQMGNEPTNWVTYWTTNSNAGYVNTITGLSMTGRYFRILGRVRGSNGAGLVGYSITNAYIYGYALPVSQPTNIAPLSVTVFTPNIQGFPAFKGLNLSSPTNALGEWVRITGITNAPGIPWTSGGVVKTGQTVRALQFDSHSPRVPKFFVQGWLSNGWNLASATNNEPAGTWCEEGLSSKYSYFRLVLVP